MNARDRVRKPSFDRPLNTVIYSPTKETRTSLLGGREPAYGDGFKKFMQLNSVTEPRILITEMKRARRFLQLHLRFHV